MRRYMMAMRDNAVQMRGLRRMLHRIRWAAGVMCFEAWLEYVSKMCAVKGMMQRALSGAMLYNFTKWREETEDAKELAESAGPARYH